MRRVQTAGQCGDANERDLAALLRPAGDEVLKVWPVSKQVNSPWNNGAELLEAIGDVIQCGWGAASLATLLCAAHRACVHGIRD